MKKFKLVSILLVLLLALTACTSTKPALTAMVMESLNVSQSSFEAQSHVKFKTNLLDYFGGEDVPEEAKLILSVLEEGFVLDLKQQDQDHAYVKFGLKNGEALQKAGVWNRSKNPDIELYMLGKSDRYFKTSTEDKFFFYNDDFVELDALGLSPGYVDSVNSFVLDAVRDYVKQFNFELNGVQNKGKVEVKTPAGTQVANHIQVKMDLKDLQGFLSYTLGNLAKYDGLDGFVFKFYDLIFSSSLLEDQLDFAITDEEMAELLSEFRAGLLFWQEQLDQVSLAELSAAELGFIPELNVDFNYYVTDQARPVKTEMKLDLTIKPTDLPAGIQVDPLTFQLESEDVYWNVKGDVQLPEFDAKDIYDLQAVLASPEMLQEVNETSIIRLLFEWIAYPRSGTFSINDTEAWINRELVELKTAPYLENGVLLVPASALADIFYGKAGWKAATKELTFAYAGNEVIAQIGNLKATVNGQVIHLEAAPAIINGEAMVPLRSISEALGAELYWFHDEKLIGVQF